jgi:hypothetical protein
MIGVLLRQKGEQNLIKGDETDQSLMKTDMRLRVRICPCLAHAGDKKVKRFHFVKSLADYHICERP